MTTIHKYLLEIADETFIEMPSYAHVLTVQVQNGRPYVWAIVNPTCPMEQRKFRLVGTGHEVDAGVGKYIGTFQMYDGKFVGHLFEANALRKPGESPWR